MNRIKALFCKSVDIIGFIDLSIIVIVGFAQVIYRYVFGKSFFWAEELSIYMMVWLGFLGAAKASVNQENTRIGFLVNLFPRRVSVFLQTIAYILTVVFLGYMIIYGFQLTSMLWQRISVAVKVPMALVYLALPVSGIFMLIFTVLALYDTVMQCLGKGSREGDGT